MSQIVASGRRKGFFIYDLAASRVEQVQGILGRQEKSCESFVTCPSGSNPLMAFLGNQGCIPLVSLASRQSVGTLKMNGTVRTAAFTADGQELLTAGTNAYMLAVSLSLERLGFLAPTAIAWVCCTQALRFGLIALLTVYTKRCWCGTA